MIRTKHDDIYRLEQAPRRSCTFLVHKNIKLCSETSPSCLTCTYSFTLSFDMYMNSMIDKLGRAKLSFCYYYGFLNTIQAYFFFFFCQNQLPQGLLQNLCFWKIHISKLTPFLFFFLHQLLILVLGGNKYRPYLFACNWLTLK